MGILYLEIPYRYKFTKRFKVRKIVEMLNFLD
jgi:hypothetical protein